jgi:hypothetical protein
LSQDVGASAKDFGFQSGKYSMELIVGDAVIENPFSWTLVSTKRSLTPQKLFYSINTKSSFTPQ